MVEKQGEVTEVKSLKKQLCREEIAVKKVGAWNTSGLDRS